MKRIIFSVFILYAFSFSIAQTNDIAKDSSAIYSVNSWIKIIDEGNYEKSWDVSSELFKRAVTKEQWVKAVSTSREPFGKLLIREIKTKKYNTQLPGVPDGEYYSFEFNSSFEKKKESVETITAILENGEWKIIGYFIR